MPITNLNPSTPLTAGWTNDIKTSAIKAFLNAGGEKMALNHGDTLALVEAVLASLPTAGSTAGADLVADLQFLATKGTSLFKSAGASGAANDYLAYVFDKMVGQSPANSFYTGGQTQTRPLGDLVATTTREQLQLLANKWLLGLDLPNPELGGDSANPNASPVVGVYTRFSDAPLFVDGASRTEVSQGQMGDCYFLAALVTVVDTKPTFVEGMIVDNGNRTWGVRFRDPAGNAVWVTVNDELPTFAGNASKDNLVIGKSSSSNEIWVPILEKAYAQLNETGVLGRKVATNSFKAIEGGFGDAMLTVAGGTSVTSFVGGLINFGVPVIGAAVVNSTNEREAVELITSAVNSGKTIWLGSWVVDSKSGVTELVAGHAYSLEDPNKSSTSDASVLVQNPWGVTVDAQGALTAGATFKSPFDRSIAELVRAIINSTSSSLTYVIQILDGPVGGTSSLAPVFFSADGTAASAPTTSAVKRSGAASEAAIKTALVQSTQSASAPISVPLAPKPEKEVRDISDTAALYLSSNQEWQILPAGSKFSSILTVKSSGRSVTDDTFDALAYKVEKLGTASTNAGTKALTLLSPSASASGYVLLLRDYSDFNAFKVAHVDANGVLDPSTIKTISAAQLYALESVYGEDLNGSDSIGDTSTLLDDGDYVLSQLADGTLQISSGIQTLTRPLTVNDAGKAVSFAELSAAGYAFDGLETVTDAAGRLGGFVLYLFDQETGNVLALNLDLNAGVTGVDVDMLGTDANDTLVGGGGNDTINGAAGRDTVVFDGIRGSYTTRSAGGITTVAATANAAAPGGDTLIDVERLKFADANVALDLGPKDNAGQALLLIGAVLGREAVLAKRPLMGAVIDLFDQGFNMGQLAGALMRLPIWGGVLTASDSNTDIARYLLTQVNGRAPSATELAAAVKSLDTDVQGTFLANLAQTDTNIAKLDLVGLAKTGFDYPLFG